MKVHPTGQKALGATFTVIAILKDTVTTLRKERCEWNSGLENVPLATSLLTLTQAGGTALSREKPISKHVTGLWKPLRALISSEKKVVAATNIRKPAKVHTNKFKSHYVMFKQ